MKYYLVSSSPVLFKQNGRAIAPPQSVVEENIINMFHDRSSTMAVKDIDDAIMLASEHNSSLNNGEGFLILEVEKEGALEKDQYVLEVNEYEIQVLDVFKITFENLTVIKAHLGHLDSAFGGNVVQLNARYEDLINIKSADDNDDLANYDSDDDIEPSNSTDKIMRIGAKPKLDDDFPEKMKRVLRVFEVIMNSFRIPFILLKKEVNGAIDDIKFILKNIILSAPFQILLIGTAFLVYGTANQIVQIAAASLASAGVGAAGAVILASPLLAQTAAALVVGAAIYGAGYWGARAMNLAYNGLTSVFNRFKKSKRSDDLECGDKLEQSNKFEQDSIIGEKSPTIVFSQQERRAASNDEKVEAMEEISPENTTTAKLK